MSHFSKDAKEIQDGPLTAIIEARKGWTSKHRGEDGYQWRVYLTEHKDKTSPWHIIHMDWCRTQEEAETNARSCMAGINERQKDLLSK